MKHDTHSPGDRSHCGRYLIEARLGRGAQGTVELVKDLHLGGPPLALKTLAPGKGGEWDEAFRREFEVHAGLSHPRLAMVHDFGTLEDGRVFFTRDWFPGDDLLTATADMDPAGIAAVGLEVCRSLVPLHAAGLVHGDLKPGNAILGPDGLVRLIDFSFARAPGSEAAARGTLWYMAPEVIEERPVDGRADLYSLGVTLFELVTGGPPFDGGAAEIAAAHLSSPPPPMEPRRPPGTSRDAALFKGLDEVVRRLLAKDPDDRFPDAGEAGLALEALAPGRAPPDPLAGAPVLPAHDWERGTRDLVRSALARLGQSTAEGLALHVVEGEPGTGRSGVCRAAKWRAQLAGAEVIETRCEDGTMLGPVATVARRAAALLDGSAADDTLGARAARLLESLDRPGPGDDLDGLALTLGRLIAGAARGRPLLLVADDIDRASPEARRCLRGAIFSAASREHFAALVSAEPGFPWSEALGPGAATRLPGLDRPRISALIRAHFGRVEETAVERVLDHTGGNPAFVSALLRELAAAGEGLERLERLGPPAELSSYWRARIPSLPPAERALLEAAAVLDCAAGSRALARVAGIEPAAAEETARQLARGGWLRGGPEGWRPVAGPLAGIVVEMAGPDRLAEISARAMDEEPDEARRLAHAAACGRVRALLERALPLAGELERLGALDAAASLLERALQVVEDPRWRAEAALALGRVLLARGESGRARAMIEPLLEDPGEDLRRSALLLLGRLHGQRRELEAAARCLDRALEMAGDPADTARLLVERANVEFVRGALPAAARLALRGLDMVPDGHPARVALLAFRGKVACVEGRHDEAVEQCRRAVEDARAGGDRRSLALSLAMLAWVRQQAGDLESATADLQAAAVANREIGDVPRLLHSRLVLGDLAWWRERWGEAVEHYEEALTLASAVGNPAQRAEALIGLGQAMAKLGRFERAAGLLERAEEDAGRTGTEEPSLRVLLYRGELAAARGHREEAMELWSRAREGLDARGRQGVAAEVELELAELLLERDGPGDRDAARALIDSAAARPREDRGRGFDDALEHLRGWLALAEGGMEQGLPILDRLADRLDQGRGRDNRLWRVHFAAARALIEHGSDALARQRLRLAEAALERLALDLPASLRQSFWQDARRHEVRRLMNATVPSSILGRSAPGSGAAVEPEARALYRLLEINKRLSSDVGVERLMEEILDAAVELSGAERGLVLRPGSGGLELVARRGAGGEPPDADHERFSRSIAESALLDREPVVTVDAPGDHRFSGFASIHELRIRSVACVPVLHRGEPLGVVYLENRLRRGRFDAGDLRVLSAFADQVAIALNQARLLEEAGQRRVELERATLALEQACARQAGDLARSEDDLCQARERLAQARRRIDGTGDFHGMIGAGPAMRRVFRLIEKVADLDVPVVLTGESGAGKDLLARVIHDAGRRRERPFVAVTCGGVPEALLEAHLFGHSRGAFSGAATDRPGVLAAAAGGSLYLDDIGEMPPRMQVDLLRVLQDGRYTPLGADRAAQVDCRLLVSSREPLEELVEQGRLRADLFYRLQVVTIPLPPLRERPEDIAALALRIAAREARALGLPPRTFSVRAMDALTAHPWPGNVRELEQAVRRALIVGEHGSAIAIEALFPGEDQGLPEHAPERRSIPLESARMEESRRILEALERCRWNRSRAARELGVSRRTLYRRLAELGITGELKRSGRDR